MKKKFINTESQIKVRETYPGFKNNNAIQNLKFYHSIMISKIMHLKGLGNLVNLKQRRNIVENICSKVLQSVQI